MCLAIPGKIESIKGSEPYMKTGMVSFGGIVKEINLSMVPEVSIGDYVLVHVGVAISKINREIADRTLSDLGVPDQ